MIVDSILKRTLACIELGVFALVFVFAIHQFHDLKQEKMKRERKLAEQEAENKNGPLNE